MDSEKKKLDLCRLNGAGSLRKPQSTTWSTPLTMKVGLVLHVKELQVDICRNRFNQHYLT